MQGILRKKGHLVRETKVRRGWIRLRHSALIAPGPAFQIEAVAKVVLR
jgi:hypothetical protein